MSRAVSVSPYWMCRIRSWRNIAIALINADFGEQTAQSCENAWLRQQSPKGASRDYNSRMGSRCLTQFVLMACVAAHPQTTKSPSRAATPGSEPVWVFNFPETPLEIRADGERAYSLKNESKAKIKSYRLGCVRESTKKNVILVYRMTSEETEIAPGEAWGIMGFHCNRDRTECERKSARLGVIEVDFQDGTLWRASAKLQED